jgi:hypothetical protein
MLLQQNCFQIQSETTSLQGGEKRKKYGSKHNNNNNSRSKGKLKN